MTISPSNSVAFVTSPGRNTDASFLIGLYVDQSIQHSTVELQVLRAEPFAPPALKGSLADAPAFGKFELGQMADFHGSLLLWVLEAHEGSCGQE